MSGMFRESHKRHPRRGTERLVLGEPTNPWRKRGPMVAALALAIALAASWSLKAEAHPGHRQHADILHKPIAGVRNNYWYDYRSDIEEAENELRKDLRRAKSEQDRREAWQEYNRELRDARSDYRKEMIEKGYIRRGEVIVGG
jgi:hypothetical protein